MTPLSPTVSIIVVNCKTLKQTQLCLRSIRRYTHYPCETIVVDNDSRDESVEYLRSLRWIRLLENPAQEPTHRNALDYAIQTSDSDVIVTLHSDTFVHNHTWLETLLSHLGDNTMIVGSQDRIIVPINIINGAGAWWRRRKLDKRWGTRGVPPKIITHCVLYRRELFTEHGQFFDHPQIIDGVYYDAGEMIQRYCEEHGHEINMLHRRDLAPLLRHFEAATLNLFRSRAMPFKRRLRAWIFYHRPGIKALINDDALDR